MCGVAEDLPSTLAEARTQWRAATRTSTLLGPDDVNLIHAVYSSLYEWITDTQPSTQRNIKLQLSGWSNGLGLLSALVQAIGAFQCRLQQLELIDSDFNASHVTELAAAIQVNSTSARSFQQLRFESITPTSNASLCKLLGETLPSMVLLRS